MTCTESAKLWHANYLVLKLTENYGVKNYPIAKSLKSTCADEFNQKYPRTKSLKSTCADKFNQKYPRAKSQKHTCADKFNQKYSRAKSQKKKTDLLTHLA